MKFTEHPVTVEVINADRATEYLAQNVCNPRPRNPKIVESWAREMLADKWYLSNDALIFDIDGNLGNGQHRMKTDFLTHMAKIRSSKVKDKRAVV